MAENKFCTLSPLSREELGSVSIRTALRAHAHESASIALEEFAEGEPPEVAHRALAKAGEYMQKARQTLELGDPHWEMKQPRDRDIDRGWVWTTQGFEYVDAENINGRLWYPQKEKPSMAMWIRDRNRFQEWCFR